MVRKGVKIVILINFFVVNDVVVVYVGYVCWCKKLFCYGVELYEFKLMCE